MREGKRTQTGGASASRSHSPRFSIGLVSSPPPPLLPSPAPGARSGNSEMQDRRCFNCLLGQKSTRCHPDKDRSSSAGAATQTPARGQEQTGCIFSSAVGPWALPHFLHTQSSGPTPSGPVEGLGRPCLLPPLAGRRRGEAACSTSTSAFSGPGSPGGGASGGTGVCRSHRGRPVPGAMVPAGPPRTFL